MVVLAGVSVIVFALVQLVPGDPIRLALGTRFDQETYDALLERSGLAQPLVQQYFGWAGGALTGDLGVSFRSGETVTAAQVIASQLEPIGVEVEIQEEDLATWLDRQSQGDFDAFLLSWIGNVDPADFYENQHLSSGGSNYQGYSNPQVDDLLTRAATEPDQTARKGLYDQAAQIIVDDVSYLYLYNPDEVQAWAPGLTGYQVRADSAIDFENVELP